MDIVFHCESANQVDIYTQLLASLEEGTEVYFTFACWDGVISTWLAPSLVKLPNQVKCFNVFEKSPRFLMEEIRNNSKRVRACLIATFDRALKQFDSENTVIVLGNDASRRGEALTFVARNRGFRFCLLQDGFLDFESKSNNLKSNDQNYNWGKSSPDIAFVWGDSFKDKLIERHNLNPKSIRVAGPLRKFEKGVKSKRKKRDTKSVLWIDQAIIDQSKAKKESWLIEFEAIANTLSSYDTHIRFHPSQKIGTRSVLADIAQKYVKIDDNSTPLSLEYLQKFDLVVCYYSTAFLDSIFAEVPCVIYRTKLVDIELPLVNHPLIKYCKTLDEIEEAIKGDVENHPSVEFVNVPKIDYFVSLRPIPSKQIVKEIVKLVNKEHIGIEKEVINLSELPLNMSSILEKKITVFAGTLGNRVGAGIPIKYFFNSLPESYYNVNFVLVAQNSFASLVFEAAGSDAVIINSLEFFKNIDIEVCKNFLDYCKKRQIKVLVYIHETEYVFQALLNKFEPKMLYAVREALQDISVLCVSTKQAQWLNKLGILDTTVVYNASPSQNRLLKMPSRFDESQSGSVIMIGTQQPRKGVNLFSHVADLANFSNLALTFSWYGAPTELGNKEYKSENAKFFQHVQSSELERTIRESGIFFLSSIDDPFPLSAIEAIAAGVPIVAYKETGIAEIIDTYGNGQIFNRYTPEAAFQAIVRVKENYDSYRNYTMKARENFTSRDFLHLFSSVLHRNLINRAASLEITPVLVSHSSKSDFPSKNDLAYCQANTDLSEFHSITGSPSQKKIDLARRALKEGQYLKAFNISSKALEITPSSTLHLEVLHSATEKLGGQYLQEFKRFEALHFNETKPLASKSSKKKQLEASKLWKNVKYIKRWSR